MSTEVYLIRCCVNGKVYIGSTTYTKEHRWSEGRGWASHLGVAYLDTHKEKDKDLYKDIRLYGSDKFELSTLERVDNRSDLLKLETKWIKYYINLLGREMVYNEIDRSNPISQLNTDEAKERRVQTFKNTMETKYGSVNAPMMTKEARIKAIDHIKEALTGRHQTPEAIENVRCGISYHILYKDQILIGAREFTEALEKDGYTLTSDVVGKIIKGYMSKNNRTLYPELDPNNPDKIWTLLLEGRNKISI